MEYRLDLLLKIILKNPPCSREYVATSSNWAYKVQTNHDACKSGFGKCFFFFFFRVVQTKSLPTLSKIRIIAFAIVLNTFFYH